MKICKFQNIENACEWQVWWFGVARCNRGKYDLMGNENCRIIERKVKIPLKLLRNPPDNIV